MNQEAEKEDLSFLSREKPNVSEDKLDKLSELSKNLKELREEVNEEVKKELLSFINILNDSFGKKVSIETLEKVLKVVKQEEQNISQILIPSILNECGLSSIKLKSGESIVVNDKIKASIPNKNIETVLKEMVELEKKTGIPHNIAYENIKGLFKSSIILEKLSEDEKYEVLELLIEKGLPYNDKKEIHWQTLNAYVRNRIEQGQNIPKSINVFKYQETKIK